VTPEQIKQWAHDAKLPEMGLNPENEFVQAMVKRIADLVVEECAKVCDYEASCWMPNSERRDAAQGCAIEIREMKAWH
jgi:hypothetical protein